jgi:FimV-like protein
MNRAKNSFRLLKKLIVFLLLLFPGISGALGFGQIKLYSYLNEPLNAEIELLGANEVDLSHLMVSLGSAQDFQKAQLARPYFLTQLRFEVVQQGNRTAIHITTVDAVKQPFLEFLVVLSWTEGQLIRGYTLLLDPAPFASAIKHTPLGMQEDSDVFNIPKKEQQALLKIQEKLTSAPLTLIKPGLKKFAKTEDFVTQDIIATGKEKTFAKENLEALFDTEFDKETAPISIEKSKAVTADFVDTATGGGSKQTAIIPANFIGKFYDNRFLLGSGLGLLFSVALTVWFLKHARETLSITPTVLKASYLREKTIAVFDGEMNLKLELARQYLGIQDRQSARDILEQVIARGNQQEKDAANLLLKTISSHS